MIILQIEFRMLFCVILFCVSFISVILVWLYENTINESLKEENENYKRIINRFCNEEKEEL